MSSEPFLGGIFLFAGNFAPRGYMLCQGQLQSIAQNTALFSILGTTYGGDGQTTFALPDLRGRMAIGQGQGPGLPNYDLGELVGTDSVTVLTSNLPPHNHLVEANKATADSTTPSNTFPGCDSRGAAQPIYNSTGGVTMNPQMLGVAGGSQPLEIQNPILGINFIIAVEGIFPSRN
jgi:microcystin-dependent protein